VDLPFAQHCTTNGGLAISRPRGGQKATMMVMAALDWSECPAVESIPGKVSGAWVLKGTRMPVSAIFENLEAGANIDDILEWYQGLNREQVKAVIEFAARSLDQAPATP
jgi:uncharacterized protein (DUF433 family)